MVLVLTIGLTVWDGGANLDPPGVAAGVTVDLRTVETERGPIEYDLSGDDGPVVLSVHAGLGGADQGRLFASWLQDDGFRILSPVAPGYLGTPLSSGRTIESRPICWQPCSTNSVSPASESSRSRRAARSRTPCRAPSGARLGLVSIGGVSRPDPQAASGSALRRTS